MPPWIKPTPARARPRTPTEEQTRCESNKKEKLLKPLPENPIQAINHALLKVNEEVRDLGKKLKQIEADLVKNKEDLEQANKNLEQKEKLLATVSFTSNSYFNDSFFPRRQKVK